MLKKTLALIALNTFYAHSQCETPVAFINEDFQTFQQESFPQNCWTSSTTTQTAVTDWYEDGDLGAFLLVGPGAQNASFLVSPLALVNEANTFSFEASGKGTLQVGTMVNGGDFTTFVPVETLTIYPDRTRYHIIFPASETPRHAAFRLVPAATTPHAVIDDVAWPSPYGCEATVDSFYEDFSAFESGGVSQHCWVGSHDQNNMVVAGITPFLSISCEQSEGVTEVYLVSPKISNLSGAHTLSFRTTGADGFYQPGTMLSPYDFGSFIPFGEPIATIPAITDFTAPLSGPETHHYSVLKFSIAPGMETSISMLRRIALDQSLNTPEVMTKAVSVYPNPVNSILNITTSDLENVTIVDMAGRKVMESKNTAINVGQLKSGVYILMVAIDGKTSTHKFVKE